MKNVPNRLWYKLGEEYRNEGKIECYEHGTIECETCPRCPDAELCENCSGDLNKHSEKKKIKCLKELGEAYKNKETLLSAINSILTNQLVYRNIKIDNEVIAKRSCQFD